MYLSFKVGAFLLVTFPHYFSPLLFLDDFLEFFNLVVDKVEKTKNDHNCN